LKTGKIRQAFKSAERCAENCSSATNSPELKSGKIAPCWFSKALGASQRNLSSNRSKGFEFLGFEKLSVNSKAFG
jgi:hypothetical protein